MLKSYNSCCGYGRDLHAGGCIKVDRRVDSGHSDRYCLKVRFDHGPAIPEGALTQSLEAVFASSMR